MEIITVDDVRTLLAEDPDSIMHKYVVLNNPEGVPTEVQAYQLDMFLEQRGFTVPVPPSPYDDVILGEEVTEQFAPTPEPAPKPHAGRHRKDHDEPDFEKWPV